MATPRQKVQVGIFLTVCGALLAGTLVVISGWHREKAIPYHTVFDESVSGLAPGSDVRYRGVPVGRVTEIAVIPTNRIRVRVEIRPSVIRVTQGMVAQLGTTGVTGQLYVNLSGGEPDATPLSAEGWILSAPSLFANLSTELPIILASINSVLVRLDKTLGEEGQVAVVMQDIGKLITVLNTTVSDIGSQTLSLLAGTTALIEHEVRPLVVELAAAAQTTRQVLQRTGPVLRKALANGARAFQQLESQLASLDLQRTTAGFQLALQRFIQLAEQLGQTSEELNVTLRHIRGNTTNTEFHIRQAVRNLRETLLSVKQLFDYLEQDPSSLLVGKRVPAPTPGGQ